VSSKYEFQTKEDEIAEWIEAMMLGGMTEDHLSSENQPKVDGTTESIEAMFDGMTEEQFVDYLVNEEHLSSENQPKVDVGTDVESIGSEEILDAAEESVSFSHLFHYCHIRTQLSIG